MDDCSTEEAPKEVVDLIRFNGVKLIRHGANMGLAAARNTAIENCTMPYFTFCDDDDQLAADFGQSVITSLKANERAADMCLAFPAKCRTSWESCFSALVTLRELVVFGVTPPVGSQVYRTSLLRDCGGYNPKVKSGVDHDLWVRLSPFNPRVSAVFGCNARVGADPTRERITTNESRRRERMSRTFDIWHKDIVSCYGLEFYNHFKKSYHIHTNFMFFMAAFQQRRFLEVLSRIMDQGVLLCLIRLLRYRLKGELPINTFFPYKSS